MSNSPSRNRYRKALEARRRARARSVAFAMIFGTLLVALILAVGVGVASIRSCSSRSSAQASVSAQPGGRVTPPRLTAALRYDPAPWFVALDNQRLILGQSARKAQQLEGGAIHIDALEARGLNARKADWKVPVGQSFSSFGISDGVFICVGAGALGDFSHVVHGYGLKDGAERWDSIVVENADNLNASLGSKLIALGWRPVKDGAATAQVRLAVYNASSGTKLWGSTPALRGVETAHCSEEGAADGLVVANWDSVISYQFCNVVGFSNAATGKPLREFSFKGHVREVQVNTQAKVAYAVTSGHDEAEMCTLYKLPLGTGKITELARFACTSEHFLLLVDGSLALLASYGEAEAGSGTHLQCFQLGKSGPVFEYQFEDQVISDIAKLPGGAGQYVLALSERLGDTGEPEGHSTLSRLRLADKAVWEAGSFDQPVLWLAPFKRECLALLQGGGVYAYNAESNDTRRLRKLLYEYSEPLYNKDRTRLAISSYPEAYRNNEPGQPMQVVVFE